MEVIYTGLFFEHKFINRGFLHGPICPIYGFGALIVMLGLARWNNTWLPMFIASFFLCSLLEYVASWTLEKLFKTKWWDYSAKPFNINGRVCLLNSTLFGTGGMLFSHFVNPPLVRLIMMPSDLQAEWLAKTLASFMTVDVLITLCRIVDFNVMLAMRKEFLESLQERFAGKEWFSSNNVSEMLASIEKRSKLNKEEFNEKLLVKLKEFSQHKKNAESFIKRFPTINSRQYAPQLEHMRCLLNEGLKEKKIVHKTKHLF